MSIESDFLSFFFFGCIDQIKPKMRVCLLLVTSVANCCSPPMLMGPSSDAYKLHPPTQRSLVGHTIPHVRPRGLSEKIALAAP